MNFENWKKKNFLRKSKKEAIILQELSELCAGSLPGKNVSSIYCLIDPLHRRLQKIPLGFVWGSLIHILNQSNALGFPTRRETYKYRPTSPTPW